MVVEDSRTSRICRNLLSTSGYGMILPVDHTFWKTYGFPPYHFNCRTSIRPIYSSMIGKPGNSVDNPSMNDFRRRKFKPQKGFGGNPLEKESWWKMTKDMAFRAAEYDLWNVIEKYAKDNKLYNFAMNLVDGSDWRNLQRTKFSAEKAKLANPLQKEVNLAKILTENGHSWYFTPVNNADGVKNPDGILDGKTAEMKILTSNKLDKIADRISECDKQKVIVSIIHITDTSSFTQRNAVAVAKNTLKKPLKFVKEVVLVFGDKVSHLK